MSVVIRPDLRCALDALTASNITLRLDGELLRASPKPSAELAVLIREHRDELYLWTLGRAVQAGDRPVADFLERISGYESAYPAACGRQDELAETERRPTARLVTTGGQT